MSTQWAIVSILISLVSIAIWIWDKRRNGRNDADYQDGGW